MAEAVEAQDEQPQLYHQNSLYEYNEGPVEGKISRVAVIGAGGVGAACASNLILLKVCTQVIMVDIAKERCEGEVIDLQDAGFLTGVRIVSGTFQDAGQADVIVITAGVGQKPGESRLQLIEKNKVIMKSIFASMEPLNPDAVVLCVSNPVDILTYIAQKVSGLHHQQVFGSGTYLDSQRFRVAVCSKLKVSRNSVHAFVLGEHGDTQFAALSAATVGGVPLTDFEDMTMEYLTQAESDARNRAYEIIQKKGATYHGVAACVAKMVDSILSDRKMVFPVSVRDLKADVCISLPAVLGRSGVERVLPLKLNEAESSKYQLSCKTMRKVLDEFE